MGARREREISYYLSRVAGPVAGGWTWTEASPPGAPLSLLDAYLTLAQPEPHTLPQEGRKRAATPPPAAASRPATLLLSVPPRTQEISPPARGAQLGRTRAPFSHFTLGVDAPSVHHARCRTAQATPVPVDPAAHAQRWLSAGPGAQGSASGPYAALASASGACADLASASGRDRASRTISRSRRSPPRRRRCWHGGRCRRARACRGRKRSRPPPSVSRRRPWACRT